MKVYLVLLGLILLCTLVSSRSNLYAHNPHHELGAVWDDQSLSLLPYWRLSGDARLMEDRVRLVPDRQSKSGSIWNTIPNAFENWEVVARIQISGRSSVGADGMAFWYVTDPDPGKTDFFGYQQMFNGLGIIIDTYDNDNTGDHPMLVGVVNDGKKTFTHSHDDHHDEDDMEVGNCHFPLRNLPSVLVRVRYESKILTVDVRLESEWKNCFQSNRLYLPKGNYFGFSAQTGDLADDHDVLGIQMKNLDDNAASIDSQETYSRPLSLYQINSYLGKIEKGLYDNMLPILHSTPSNIINSRGSSDGAGCDTSGIIRELQNQINSIESHIGDFNRNAGRSGSPSNNKQERRALDNMRSSLNKMKSSINDLERNVKSNISEGTSIFTWVFILLIIASAGAVYYLRIVKPKQSNPSPLF